MNARIVFIFALVLSSCLPLETADDTDTQPTSNRTGLPIIDVSRYKEIMTSFEKSLLIEHFPASIPTNAIQVEFAYQPRIMQGAMFVELLMTLPEPEINALQEIYTSESKYMFLTTEIPYDLPEPILFLLRDENYEYESTFTLYVFEAEPAGKDNHPWNHGTYYGVGIDARNSKVIYWSQYW